MTNQHNPERYVHANAFTAAPSVLSMNNSIIASDPFQNTDQCCFDGGFADEAALEVVAARIDDHMANRNNPYDV